MTLFFFSISITSACEKGHCSTYFVIPYWYIIAIIVAGLFFYYAFKRSIKHILTYSKQDLQINNVQRLYSKILVQQSSSKEEDSINLICEAFKSGNKLKPIGCLSDIWKSKDENEEEEEFLIKESPNQVLQAWGGFAALIIPVITVIITVVQFLLKYLWNIGGK
jgi:hypothetical protein